MATPPEFGDRNLFLSAAGQRVSLDNETLSHTPAPVAASTVARPVTDPQRLSDVQGSFLDDLSGFVNTPASGHHQSHIRMASLRDTPGADEAAAALRGESSSGRRPVSEGSQPSQPDTFNRSSLGLIPIDNMDELSSNMLHMADQSHQSSEVQTRQQADFVGENPGFMEYESSEMAQSMRSGALNRVSVKSTSAHGAPGVETLPKTTQGAGVFELQQESLTREVPGPTTTTTTSISSGSNTAVQGEIGYDVCGGKNMDDIARAAMLFGGHDADASLHEVEINAEELEQFDDEFSDIGDMDHTMTEMASPEHGEDLSKPVQATNLFDTPQPNPLESLLYPLDTEEIGLDEVDTVGHQTGGQNGNTVGEGATAKKMSFSLLQECPNFQDFMQSDCNDLFGSSSGSSGHQQQHHGGQKRSEELGQRSEFTRTAGAPGYERETNQGEGQEADMSVLSVARGEFELDSVYLHGATHQGGEGGHREDSEPEEDAGYRPDMSSIMFGNSPPHPRSHTSHEDSRAYDSSEIDTEDEVEAVRREMMETYNRMNEGSQNNSQERPDLEGWNQSLEREDVRQSAEGVVENVLPPGDGDGRDNSGVQLSGGQRAATTFQVLQQLGFGAVSPGEEEPDWPQSYQSESRLLPTGTDQTDLCASQDRRVRFADFRESGSRDRTVSGASEGDPERAAPSGTGQASPQTPQELPESEQMNESHQQQHLASCFLTPYTPGLGVSQMSDYSQVHGLEDSTFNLSDLVPRDTNTSEVNGHVARQHALGSDVERETRRQLVNGGQEVRQEVIGLAKAEREEPEVDQVLPSAHNKEANQDHSSSQGEKTFLSDDSPVYINAQGECVTDLAYQVPLDKLAHNPFDDISLPQVNQTGNLSEMFGSSEGGGVSASVPEFGSSDFMTGAEGLAMLSKDESKFEKEHKFDHFDQVDSPPQNQSHFQNTAGSSLGLPESWSLHSHLEDPTRPSWLSDTTCEAPHTRISIGAFMGARTEALGSLDGEASTRPAFGNQIVTPPSDRKPVTLYEKTPPSTLRSIDENGGQEDVRGAGVGSDSDSDREDQPHTRCQNQPTTEAQYNPKTKPSEEPGIHERGSGQDQDQIFGAPAREDRPPTPKEILLKHLVEHNQEAVAAATARSGASTPDMADVTGVLDLSEITRLITTASSSAKPKELTDMILKLSHSKKLEKYGEEVERPTVSGETRTRPTEVGVGVELEEDGGKSNTPQVVEAHFNGKPVTNDQVTKQRSEFNTEIRVQHGAPNGQPSTKVLSHTAYGRVPADGISEKIPASTSTGTAPSAKPGKPATHQPNVRTVKDDQQKAKTKPSIEKQSQRASVMHKQGAYSASNGADTSKRSSDGSGKGAQWSRPPSHGIVPASGHRQQNNKHRQSNLDLSRSKIPVHHGKSPEAAGATARIQVGGEQRNVAEGKKIVYPNKRGSKGQTVNHTTNKSKGRIDKTTVRDKENAADTSVQQKHPSTPKHLVLREKDFTSPGGYVSPEQKDMEDSITQLSDDNEGDITWKSPRPSSVMSRSSRQDSMMLDDDSFYNSYQRPAELEGAQFKQPKTPPSSKTKHVNPIVNGNAERQIPGIDDPAYGIRVQHTNGDGSEKTSAKSRLSSTPLGGGDPLAFTMGTQDSFSHIGGGSPHARRVQDFTDDSHNSTLTLDQGMPHTGEGSFEESQSTPKVNQGGYHQYTAQQNGMDHNHNRDLPPQPHYQRNTLQRKSPTSHQQDPYQQENAKVVPTLLTDKPLSKTVPAAQFNIHNNAESTKELLNNYPPSQTWKSATAPSVGSKISSGSYSVEAVYIKVPSELRIPEVCCVGLSTHCSLTLENPTQRWVQVHVKLVSLSMDGQAADMSRIMPFVMKEKVIVKPNSHEDIKVIFAPRQAGVYVGQLHVVASPVVSDEPLQPTRVPAMVTLQALAEKPQVQIITPDKAQLLDFRALPWGCVKGMAIALINKSRATVPVRLIISSSKSQSYHGNCFTFERYTTGDTSMISNKNRPNIPAMSPCVVNYSLKGCGGDYSPHPMQVMVYFVAPSRHVEKGQSGFPEDFMARLDVEVDTPSTMMSLGSLILKSRAGTARLHTHTEMQEISQRAELGRFQTQAIPLRNAGNIPIEVSLEVAQNADCFSVFPTQLMIEPQGDSHCTIKYQPRKGQPPTVNSLLLMQIEPDGQSYELELTGETVSSEPVQPAVPVKRPSKGPSLFSNKTFLAWGGVPVSRAHQQTITLKNVTEHMLKLRLEIRSSHQDFNIQSLYGKKERLAESKEVLVRPQEQYPVHVLFAPSQVTNRDGQLIIRVVDSTTKYTIPLSGYGGISKLVMEEVQKGQNSNFWVSVGTPESGHSLESKLILRNIGTRAAYVKAIAFEDLRCKQGLQDTRLSVQPDEFCIKEKQTQEVTVILHTNDRDALICQEKANILAAVACFYGDEVSRQQLRRAVQKYGPRCLSKCPDKSPAQNYKFHLPFEGEDLITEECVKDTPNDVELFYSNMSKITLAIVGEPHIPSPTPPSSKPPVIPPSRHHPKSFKPASYPRLTVQQSAAPPASWEWNSDTGTGTRLGEETDQSATKLHGEETKPLPNLCSPPERLQKTMSTSQHHRHQAPLSSSSLSSRQPLRIDTQSVSGVSACTTAGAQPAPGSGVATTEGGAVLEWGVIPPQLILSAPTKNSDSLIKQVQLLNVSERVMTFELSWPAHCITVNPERGSISPRQSASINVSCNTGLKSKGVQLPWSGNVHINCDGGCQILKIQIRESVATSEDPLLKLANSTPSVTSVTSEPNTPLVSIVTPPDSRAPVQRRGAPQWLGFKDTSVSKIADAEFDITNLCAQPVKWIVSSFNPPYVKISRAEQSVERVGYSAFWLPKQAGFLQPGEKNKIQVCFQPRGPGLYSQHWQLKAEAQVSAFTSTSLTNMEFCGQGVENPVLVDSTNRGISWVSTDSSKSKVIAQIPPSKSSKAETADDEGPIEVRCQKLSFPDTSRHENHMCKLELKNRDRVPHKVTIVEPHSPFNTRHSKVSIKRRHYVRVPVHFSPQKAGHYQGELVIKVDTGHILTVPLLGTCVAH